MSLISAVYLIILLDTADTQPMIVIPQSSMKLCKENALFLANIYKQPAGTKIYRQRYVCING